MEDPSPLIRALDAGCPLAACQVRGCRATQRRRFRTTFAHLFQRATVRPVAALYDRVLAFIDDAGADRFETLALDVFAHQFAHCTPYREYCLRRHQTPDTVADWRAIPPVPIVAFKRADLSCGPAVRTFFSSGTTEGVANRSRHLIPDLRLYQHAARAGLRQFLFPDVARMRLISLIHRVDELPQSSLAQMVAWAMAEFGEADSRYAVTADGID